MRGTYAYRASEKLTCEYMPSLHHADLCLSRADTRPGNSLCAEEIGGGRDTHLYTTSRFGQDWSEDQVSELRSGVTASVVNASDERRLLLMDFLRKR